MILPWVELVKDMRIVLSRLDIFWIFVKYLINEKKHTCNSSSRKKYDHLESEFNIVTMQRIEPNSYGYRIKYINVLRRDIFTLERSMFRKFYFKILITWIFDNAVVRFAIQRRDFQLNMQQVHVCS